MEPEAKDKSGMQNTKVKILLAEDSLFQAEIYKRALLGKGYEVVVAKNGVEGLAAAKEWKPTLIVSDIFMPVMDGFQFLRNIKKDKDLKSIPFVFYSTFYTDDKDREFALSLGAKAFLIKLKDPEEMCQKIKAILEGTTIEEKVVQEKLIEKEEDFLTGYCKVVVAKLDKKVKELEEEITERKRVEDMLRKNEEWVRAISESANDAIICIDDTGIVNFWNKKAEEMFGYSTNEAIGRAVCALIIPERYREKHTEGLKTFSRTGTGPVVGKPIELSSLRKDGKEFPIELSVSAMKINERWQAIGIIRDITDRKRSEEKISIQLQRLSTLREIDEVITSTLDKHISLDMFLEKALTQLKVDAANVLLFDQQMQELEYIAARGFHKSVPQHQHIRLGEGVVGRIAAERRIRYIPNLIEVKEEWIRKELITDDSFTAYCGIPLVAKGQLKGVFEVFHHAPFSDDPEWMNYLETLAGQAAIAIDNTTLFEDLQRSNAEIIQAYDDTIEGWSRALDMRDRETEGHCRRVTDMTLMVARAMNIPKEHLIHIRRGALLHDIGKVGIPDNILQKPGPLTEEEWVIMRKHPVYAYELLSPVAYLRPAMDIPYCHHEKWDGTGYPRGLKGEQIPIAARVFAVVDISEALRSVRVYKPAWPEEKVREHIRSLAGTHLDPKVVYVFLGMKW